MGNSYSLKGQEIVEVPNDIYLHDKTYVFNKKFCLNVKKETVHEKKRYIFYDKNTRTYFLMFKPLPDFDEVYLCDMRNRPVLSMKDNKVRKTAKIFIKDDNKKFRVRIKFENDKVIVNFINKANGKKELLQIKTNKKLTQVGIYYGELENSPLIAKFYLKEKGLQVTKEYNYVYEIAPGVDMSFMAMLAIYLNRYRLYLADNTALYSDREVLPPRRSSNNSDSTTDSNRSKSNRSLKIKHIPSNNQSDIEINENLSLPQADNKSKVNSTHNVNARKTPSVLEM